MILLDQWNKKTTEQKKQAIRQYRYDAKLDAVDITTLCENVDVVDGFIKKAHEAAEHTTHYGARGIVEVLRFHTLIKGKDPTFKINNNMTPLLARISMAMFPRLNGFFETRGTL